MANFVQSSFLGGEWSQTAQGNFTKPDYRAAMNTCLNGLPLEQGAWTRRPGFILGGQTNLGQEARTISYAIQENMPYTMEFTSGNLRFWNGPQLAVTNDEQVVVSISAANPAVVTTTTAHGWPAGATVLFSELGVNNPMLANRQFTIQLVSGQTNEMTLYDAMTGVSLDGSTIGSFVSGSIEHVQVLPTVYSGTTWNNLQAVQADTNAILLHGSFAPQIVVPTVSAGDATFVISPVDFKDGPYLDPVIGGAQVTPSGTQGIISLTLAFATYSSSVSYNNGDYVVASGISYQSTADFNINNTPSSSPSWWTVVSPANSVGPNGFVTTDIGRHVRLNAEPPLWASGTTYPAGATVTYGANTYWTSLAGSNTGNTPGSSLTFWEINTSAANWTWGKITALNNTISGTLSGIAYIGNMTGGGGLGAAFNGSLDQSSAASAYLNAAAYNEVATGVNAYIGINYGGCSPSAFAMNAVTIVPSTDFGCGVAQLSIHEGYTSCGATWVVSASLYSSNSPPSSWNNGILQATIFLTGQDIVSGNAPYPKVQTFTMNGSIGGSNAPITLTPADQTTTYQYWWVAITNTLTPFYDVALAQVYAVAAQVEFVSSSVGTNAGGVNVSIAGPPLASTSAIRTWRLGLYNSTIGWPTCGTYHEGRLWLSGAVKNRIDASKPNQPWANYISFAPTNEDGSVDDSSGIDYTFNSDDVNSIQWMRQGLQGITCGTERGEWLVQATTLNSPLSALNIQAHEVTKQGSSVVATALPVFTEHTVVFIQRYARKLIEYFADIFSGKFTAPNIAENAEHLSSAANPLVELAYQQNISPNIWARTLFGNLLGCAYKRDTLMSSQGPTSKGWHRHELGSGRTVASLTLGPTPDGTLDTPIIVTAPVPGAADSAYRVCFMGRIFEETDALSDAQFLDEAVIPSYYTVTSANLTLYGLWPLNGNTCTVFAGGLDCGDFAISGGVLVVPFTANPLLTQAFVTAFAGAMPILVGFTYNSDGQLVRPNNQQDAMTRSGTAFGRMGRIAEFAAKLVNAQAISFGTDFSKLDPAAFTDAAGNPFAANLLFSGTYWSNSVQDDSSRDGSKLCWRISRPYPATVVAISGNFQAEG